MRREPSLVRSPSEIGELMRSILTFFSLSFALSWVLWFAARAILLRSSTPATGLLGELPFLPGVFAPAIVALALTWRAEGQRGVSALLRRLFQWRVPARWYAFAVSYVALIDLATALVHRMLTGAWPRFGTESWYVIAFAIISSTVLGGQAGEELGWRGYALPRMAARFGLARSSLVLGVLWAAWHLPLFFVPGVDKFGQSFVVYVLGVTAMSVAMAWLYAHTKGSLLLAMLMHSSANQTLNIVPATVPAAGPAVAFGASLVAWITVGLTWIAATYFLVRMPRGKWPAHELASAPEGVGVPSR